MKGDILKLVISMSNTLAKVCKQCFWHNRIEEVKMVVSSNNYLGFFTQTFEDEEDQQLLAKQ
jgi:hypothetical protein